MHCCFLTSPALPVALLKKKHTILQLTAGALLGADRTLLSVNDRVSLFISSEAFSAHYSFALQEAHLSNLDCLDPIRSLVVVYCVRSLCNQNEQIVVVVVVVVSSLFFVMITTYLDVMKHTKKI